MRFCSIFNMIGRINVIMPAMRSSGGALEDPEFIVFSFKVVVLVGIAAGNDAATAAAAAAPQGARGAAAAR